MNAAIRWYTPDVLLLDDGDELPSSPSPAEQRLVTQLRESGIRALDLTLTIVPGTSGARSRESCMKPSVPAATTFGMTAIFTCTCAAQSILSRGALEAQGNLRKPEEAKCAADVNKRSHGHRRFIAAQQWLAAVERRSCSSATQYRIAREQHSPPSRDPRACLRPRIASASGWAPAASLIRWAGDDMGATFRYLAFAEDHTLVLDWFRALTPAPIEFQKERGLLLYFEGFGLPEPLDPKRSPLISVFPPRQRRAVLWTAAEVHFLPTPLREVSPALHRISRRFSSWIRRFPCVFERRGSSSEWNYYLEGSLRNWDTSIFALPSAMAALQRGQYFVSDHDNDHVVETLCKSLRLRGVPCGNDG